ncbi:type II toxin-antitoxin system RelE/ParE family toxin [Solirhodobacter olei]|uniref:type II toxin-antitoxin system RelE/ParE family toxin n=1 Tax=Solirhodobacter olei TaxID=2493082 RepID=UPI000FD7F812|nr:type II toxin-antitoxin system RelE/ParE family toxin [Solirhodobacter olei]
MIEVRQSERFGRWLRALKDQRAVARIATRIARLERGAFGDVKYFDGIGELRIDYGPGYRVYLVRTGDVVVVLLCGGDKSSQRRNIARARDMAKEV